MTAADRQRARLMKEIDRETRMTAPLTGRKRLSDRVRAAMAAVPREDFVPADERKAAFVNRPLPIGHGQTISQPYIVAIMSELLDLAPEHRVLEIGTGSGYQAAVLAKLARHVYSVEVVPDLAATARDRLDHLGYANVSVRAGDGWSGWPEEAPFDRIIVTAAADEVPSALVAQLAPGGRMVIPVGGRWAEQTLTVLTKSADGAIATEDVLPVAFVPMVHGGDVKAE